ncbi:MAG: hypothetical protein CMG75_03375 [Candidatus Marinimicrobia bacterium]|nr:hypothetical protein [Candidatus Neomarinimicrobiota bacterium]|tara:strand:- start:24832 stop:25530 length:699 start_codon:yes stop_codon:yes gene_type:complete
MKKNLLFIFVFISTLSAEFDINEFISKGIRESYGSPENLQLMTVASLAIFGLINYDDDMRELSQKKPVMSKKLSKLLDIYGGRWAYPTLLGMIAFSPTAKKEKANQLIFASSSIGATIATTYLIKFSISRLRPDGSNRRSFPSGHTSGSFVLAAITHELYGKELGSLLYVVGSLVGAQRVFSNKHWFTDVIAGATLGTMIGRGFSIAFNSLGKDSSNKRTTDFYIRFSIPIH